jgi:hypothetical protein
VTEIGLQRYQASFLINPVNLHHLDLELPVPPANLSNLKVLLGQLPAPWAPLEEGAIRPMGSSDPTRVIRLPLGGAIPAQKPTLLEVSYQLGPGQVAGKNLGLPRALGTFQTLLSPPRLCGDTGRAPVRWQVLLLPDWFPIYQDDAFPAERRWTWRGWLPAAGPAESSADLERWFAGPDGTPVEDAAWVESNTAQPSVMAWRTDLEPLQIIHAPQQTWLLACSLVLLAVGLVLQFLPVRQGVAWMLLLLLGAAAAAAGLYWPGVLWAVLYGCEPGLAALVVVLGLQWLLHQRYRRQVVFLPGFKRVKPGSSLVRNGGSSRPRGEPSTVDIVPPVANSPWAAGTPSAPESSHTKGPVS